ncbi:MAG TPA: DUF1801 domain-containing protein [Candidatus Acidoferrales bacterium]|nr:DUF1801 domain-containing protein [Candidatus Acidoferrales bacterium]
MLKSPPRKRSTSSSKSNVDIYIRSAPKESRAKLRQLREIIKAAAPTAKESISYRMPYYNYYGALLWFAAFKNHIGFFVRPPIVQNFKMELKGYKTSKGTVQFPIDKPLPVTLIRKLIKARMTINKASA